MMKGKMQKKFKIIVIILAGFLVLFFIANLLLSIFATKIVASKIEQKIKLKTKLDSVGLAFPLKVRLSGLELGELAKIKTISFGVNPLGLFAGKILISGLNIVEPVINLRLLSNGSLDLPALENKWKQPPVFLTGLSIRNGRIIYTDEKITPEGNKIFLDKVNLTIAKVAFPLASLKANFNLNINFTDANRNSLGRLESSGWIDFGLKSMDASVALEELEVTQFAAYYGNFISNKKLLSAKLNLDSTLRAENNFLIAENKLRLFDLNYALLESEEQSAVELDLFKNALDLFMDTRGNLDLEFEITTRLDKPELSKKKLKEIILKAAMKNLSHQSPQAIVNKIMSTVEQLKGYGKQLKGIFKE